jgi:hypothetical protein
VQHTDDYTQTSFKGTYVQRQYRRGQKFVQLLFESDQGAKLAISRNVDMIQSLEVGQTYEVEGAEYSNGKRLFLYEPMVTLTNQKVGRAAAVSLLIGMVLLLIVVPGTVVAYKFRGTDQAHTNINTSEDQSDINGPDKVHPLLNTAKDEPENETKEDPAFTPTQPEIDSQSEQTPRRNSNTSSSQSASQNTPEPSAPAQQSQTEAPTNPPPPPPPPQSEEPVVPPPPPVEEGSGEGGDGTTTP